MKKLKSALCGVLYVYLLLSGYIVMAQSDSDPVANDFSAIPAKGPSPLEVHFVDQTSNATTEWQWTFDGGNPASSTYKNPVIVYDSPGVYSVKLIIKDSNGYDTIYKENYIEVSLGKPAADFSASATSGEVPLKVNFSDHSTNNPTAWVWEFTGGTPNKSNIQNPSVTYSKCGKYAVRLLASNATGADEVTKVGYIEVEASSGINKISFEEIANIFPNPVKDYLNIEIKKTDVDMITIYNQKGAIVYNTPALEENYKIDLNLMPSGLYFLKLQGHDNVYVTKLLVN